MAGRALENRQPVHLSARCATIRTVAIADEWPWELLDALDAAAARSAELHLDLCPVWAGEFCSCGVPGMLVAVRDRVFAQAGERAADRAAEAQQAA